MPNINLKHKSINGVVLRHSLVHNGLHSYALSKKERSLDNTIDSTNKAVDSSKGDLKKSVLGHDGSDKTIYARTVSRSNSEGTELDNAKNSTQSLVLMDKCDVELSLRCGIIIHPLKDGYAARANNVWSYLELNRNVGLPLS